MSHARLLKDLCARGEPVDLIDLAQQLLASAVPVAPEVARRVVGAALGRSPGQLSDRLTARDLAPGPDPVTAVPLTRAEFAVVDLETTGLSTDGASILEIGAVRVSALRITDRFATLVNPNGAVPRTITALTGISTAMVADAPPPSRAMAAFRGWLDAAPRAPFVAHNAGFDERFVRRDLARHGLAPLTVPVLCTRRLARRIAPELGRWGLDAVSEGLGIRNAARHRALGDAEAAAEALIELLERARTKMGITTVGDLIALQASRPPPLPRRGGRG